MIEMGLTNRFEPNRRFPSQENTVFSFATNMTLAVAVAATATAVVAVPKWRQPWIFAAAAGVVVGGLLDRHHQRHRDRLDNGEMFFSVLFGGLLGMGVWLGASVFLKKRVHLIAEVPGLVDLQRRFSDVERNISTLVARFGDGVPGEAFRKADAALTVLSGECRATAYYPRVLRLQGELRDFKGATQTLQRQFGSLQERLTGVTGPKELATFTERLEAINERRRQINRDLTRSLGSMEREANRVRSALLPPSTSPAVVVPRTVSPRPPKPAPQSAFDKAVAAMAAGDTATYSSLMAAHDRVAAAIRKLATIVDEAPFKTVRDDVDRLVTGMQSVGGHRLEEAKRLQGQLRDYAGAASSLNERLRSAEKARKRSEVEKQLKFLVGNAEREVEGLERLLQKVPERVRAIPTERDIGDRIGEVVTDFARLRAVAAAAAVPANGTAARVAMSVAPVRDFSLSRDNASKVAHAIWDLEAGQEVVVNVGVRTRLRWTIRPLPQGEWLPERGVTRCVEVLDGDRDSRLTRRYIIQDMRSVGDQLSDHPVFVQIDDVRRLVESLFYLRGSF